MHARVDELEAELQAGRAEWEEAAAMLKHAEEKEEALTAKVRSLEAAAEAAATAPPTTPAVPMVPPPPPSPSTRPRESLRKGGHGGFFFACVPCM